MGNNEYSDEELLRYLKNGWHFHVKKVNEYAYIVRRKGQATRSLGRYDESLWMRIRILEQKVEKEAEVPSGRLIHPETGRVMVKLTRRDRRRIAKAREDVVRSLGIFRGSIMSDDCVHIEDGFCQYWRWKKEMPFLRYMEDIYLPGTEYKRKYTEDDGEVKWIVKADSINCVNCPVYESKDKRESCTRST